jgi:hypothetical protein
MYSIGLPNEKFFKKYVRNDYNVKDFFGINVFTKFVINLGMG